MLICSQFKQDTPRQLVHKSVQGTPNCRHVQFFTGAICFAATLDNF